MNNDVDGPTNSRRKTDKKLTDLRSTGMKYTSIMCVCIHVHSVYSPEQQGRAFHPLLILVCSR